jgi:RING finger protein 121
MSFAIGLIGYCMMIFVFFGFGSLFKAGPGLMDTGVLFLCYGLYFG